MRLILVFTILIISCQIRNEPTNIQSITNVETNDADINDILEIYNIGNTTDAGNKKKYECGRYNLMLSENNDNTDIYLPEATDEQFYLILLLQGSDLSKENYKRVSEFICNYGFIVIVFDHFKESFSGKHLYSEQNVTNEIYHKIVELSYKDESILFGKVKSDKFILLGHSYGAGCGLFMIGGECKWPFCSDNYQRLPELSGGVFYGITLKSPFGETYYKINNDNIPVLLIAGDNDGVIKYEYAKRTLESIQNPPKIFVGLKGANHYAINDSNPPPGADADKNIQTLNQSIGIEIISSLTASFILEYILRDENSNGSFEHYVTKFSDMIEINWVN